MPCAGELDIVRQESGMATALMQEFILLNWELDMWLFIADYQCDLKCIICKLIINVHLIWYCSVCPMLNYEEIKPLVKINYQP